MNKPIQNSFVFLTPGFPKNEQDTSCLPFIQLFIKRFSEQNAYLKIFVITFQYPFNRTEYQWHNITVKALGGKNKGNFFRLLTWYRAWITFKKIKNSSFKIRGILSFWLGECALIGHHFSKRYNILHKCWLQGQDAKKGNHYFKKINTNNAIAISDFIADEVFRNYSIRIPEIIPAGIETKLFASKETEIRNIDILAAGSLIPLKRFDIFIDIVEEIKKVLPQIKCMLCGDGPEIEKLKLLIAEKKVDANVIVTGNISYEKMLTIMQNTKVFLHTSFFEGFSGVCAEALYAGAKVISFVKPMHCDFINWKIANTKEEMAKLVLQVLQATSTSITYTSSLTYSLGDCVDRINQLFKIDIAEE